MVVGARCTGLCQELQHCWVFHAEQFPVCIKNGPPLNGHPANCVKHWSHHGPASHLVESMPQRIEAVMRVKWGGIRELEGVNSVDVEEGDEASVNVVG